MLKPNLALAIVFAMAATAHAQPSLSPGPAPGAAAAPIGAPPSDALPESSLTLSDALAVAARNNPALRGARADVDRKSVV